MKKYAEILEIQDPSGEIRRFRIGDQAETIGNSAECTIPLRDSTLPAQVATIVEKRRPNLVSHRFAKSCSVLRGNFARRIAIPSKLTPGNRRYPDLPNLNEARTTFARYPESHIAPWKTLAESGRYVLWLTKQQPLPFRFTSPAKPGRARSARASLHHWSDRATGPFVPIDCGALPISLALESGSLVTSKGPYTGAFQSRPGALMQAHNGDVISTKSVSLWLICKSNSCVF